MNPKITLKLAEPRDLEFIFQSLKDAAIEENLSHRFFLTKEGLFEALFSEKTLAQVWLAFLDNQPVGLVLFSMTHRNFDLFNGPGIYVHSLYISPSFRRMKIGSQLIEQVKQIAKERDCCRIDWVVLKQNQNAIEFYKTMNDAKEVDYVHYMRMDV
jgi:ribosomal protein S18 acetylase RimI-like enzyme